MKTKFKLLALFLAILTVVSVFAACNGDNPVTTDVSDTSGSETDEPNTDTTETDPVKTEPAETDPAETEPIEPDVEAESVIADLNFDTELSLADYIASVDSFEINDALSGGEIKDGKWVYSTDPLALKDCAGIFSIGKYSVEFDVCFNSYVTRDNTSVFSLLTDDDGVLGTNTKFYIPFKMNTDGTIFHNDDKLTTKKLELGKVYNYRLEVNSTDKNVVVYIDGEKFVSCRYEQPMLNYQCFRFMDIKRGADMWIDNFVVKDLESNSKSYLKAVDGAYVRGGQYATQVMGLADGVYIDLKYSEDVGYIRDGLIKFDIAHLKDGDVGTATITLPVASLAGGAKFDVYVVDSDWDSKTVTYKTAPTGEKIYENIALNSGSLEVGMYLAEAVEDGKEFFSIRITPTAQTSQGQSRIDYTSASRPALYIGKGKLENNYYYDLSDDAAKNKEIWAYAQQIFDEWYARYKAMPAVNANANKLSTDASQYTKTNYASTNAANFETTKQAYKSRTLESLIDLDKYVSNEFKNAKLDKYGGIMVESLKQKATGFFYAEKIGERWWIIDPLGYPYIAVGLSDIHYSQLGSKLQKENALKIYGDYDSWALATTKQVRDEFNFNSTFRPVDNMMNVDNGLPFSAPAANANSTVLKKYGNTRGVTLYGMGRTRFTEKNTMPVFDPDFVTFVDGWAKENITFADSDMLIGYMSDNELPIDVDMLDRSLSVNYHKEVNWYTYACAWTWLINMTGKKAPSTDDITDELRDLYRGFVYDRYYSVVTPAIKKYDPNHMYLGTRYLTDSVKSEWIYRFTALYVDCFTLNWYSDWEPNADYLYALARNCDRPFIVSEFYTKAGDSGLGNSSGGGWYVETQTDRADFYDTFTIRMLETDNCVGWQWLQYMDNDPNSGTSDSSSVDSNKGLYTSDFKPYTELAERMAKLNENVYNIIDYFANKNR